MVKNVKIQKFKCDILSNFQTMCQGCICAICKIFFFQHCCLGDILVKQMQFFTPVVFLARYELLRLYLSDSHSGMCVLDPLLTLFYDFLIRF